MEMAFQVSGLIAGISAEPRGTDAAVIFEKIHIFAFEAATGPEVVLFKVFIPMYGLSAAATHVLVVEKILTGFLERCLSLFSFFRLANDGKGGHIR